MYPHADSFGVKRAQNALQRVETAKAKAWGKEEKEQGAGHTGLLWIDYLQTVCL